MPLYCARNWPRWTAGKDWNARYLAVQTQLLDVAGLLCIARADQEQFVGSSIQFLLPAFTPDMIETLLMRCGARGVVLKWFGAAQPDGFTSSHKSWRYTQAQELPQTDRILAGLIDMRLPLTFSVEDCDLLAEILGEEISRVYRA